MKLKTSMLGLAGLVTLGVQAQAQTHNADDLAYNGEVGRIINENCVGLSPRGRHWPYAVRDLRPSASMGSSYSDEGGKSRNASLRL